MSGATSATKRCTRCRRELPREAFGRRTASRDGLTASCRTCLHRAAQRVPRAWLSERLGPRQCVVCHAVLPAAVAARQTCSTACLFALLRLPAGTAWWHDPQECAAQAARLFREARARDAAAAGVPV